MRSLRSLLALSLLFVASQVYAQCGGCGGRSYGGCGVSTNYGGCGANYGTYSWCGGVTYGTYGRYAPSTDCGCGQGTQGVQDDESEQPTTTIRKKSTKPPVPGPTTYENRDSANLVVDVPRESQVEINGKATSSTGERRTYLSPNLQYGSVYRYNIFVDGVTKTVYLRAGEAKHLNFMVSPTMTAQK